MINVSNFTSKDKPPWLLAEPARPTPVGPASTVNGVNGATRQASPPPLCRLLALAAGVLLSWLAALPRRLGDRLFAANDNEAYWRGWQITRVHGGLGRRYRDPLFDTLAECPHCRGTRCHGLDPCTPCQGTGRVTLGEVG